MHVLIAPNAFKNSLTADEAAAAIRRGLSRSRLTATAECFPVGDGGDGTGDLLIQRLKGERISAKARDPLDRTIDTYFGLIEPSSTAIPTPPAIPTPATAIIEMANASGLRLLDRKELNPLHASSAGTGDLIRAALDHNAKRIIIGMGGSATVDGGTGILRALGARFLTSDGQPLNDLPAHLPDLASIDLSGLDPRLASSELIVLCDVTNPLTGPRGAAAVFGPQKGADPAAVRHLESGLKKFAEVIFGQTGLDLAAISRTGTAGGAAAALYGLLHASLVSGIDYFLDITGFDTALDRSNWVITGEGRIDEQTLQGKGPCGVARGAKRKGIPVIGLTGRLPPKVSLGLRECFDMLLPINPEPLELAEALRLTAVNLERTAVQLGDWLAGR
jgi:glycerate kinase